MTVDLSTREILQGYPLISVNRKLKMNYPAAEQRGILKNIERPKGRGLVCLRQDQTLVRLWRIEDTEKDFNID